MPRQIISAWMNLIVPTTLLTALLALEMIAARKLGHATAWKAMRPMFVFGFVTLAIMLVFFVIRCYPFYLHNRVWSHAVSRQIRWPEMISAFVMLIWCLVSSRRWREHALRVEAEHRSRQ